MAARAGGSVLLIDLDAADHYRRKAGEARAATARRPDPSGRGAVGRARPVGGGQPMQTPLGAPSATAEEARAFLELMRGAFSRIVLVGARDFETPDARRLHALADASILMVQAEATRAPAARRMREVVLASGGDLLGFVFTGRRRHVPEAIYRWL